MTTNVIDKNKKILASDSRWSCEIKDQNLLVFVDDTGFDKIGDRAFGSIICAGDAVLIEEWKNWFSAPILNTAAMPRTERYQDGQLVDLTMSVWVKPECTVTVHCGWYLNHEEEAFFAGSGATYAKDCFSKNRCGKQAVTSASLIDDATGGQTKFVELLTNRHNLSTEMKTLADAVEQLRERGMVMDIETKKVVPIQDVDEKGMDALKAITDGRATLSAPTGLPARTWSESERDTVKKAFEKIAELERNALKA